MSTRILYVLTTLYSILYLLLSRLGDQICEYIIESKSPNHVVENLFSSRERNAVT